MKVKRSVSWVLIGMLIAGLAGSAWAGAVAPASARSQNQPAREVTADGFGYWFESVTYNWVEINSVAPVSFLNNAYDYAGPIDLGFSFPFYENSYSELYLTTNGLLAMGQALISYGNTSIPLTAWPNNLIAPLWTNAPLGDGKVYVKSEPNASPRRFIVEWEGTGSSDDPIPLTYQAILYETGDIVFQYKQVGTNLTTLTIGVEDPDGYHGSQFMNNTPGLTASTALRFHRPAAAPRVKVLPRLQGGFVAQGGARYPLVVKNTGDVTNNVYDLSVTSSVNGWTSALYDNSGVSLLRDTNQNGLPDTGAIAPHSAVTVTLEVHAPAGSAEGSATTLTLTANSALSAGVSAQAVVQAAVPMQFAQVYVNNLGIRLGQFWNVNVIERPVLDLYTGASMSMESISQGDYLVGWEYLDSLEGKNFTDIHYKVVNRLTGSGEEKILTNGADIVTQEPNLFTADARSPSVAVAPDGNIGMVWSVFKQRPVASRMSPYVTAADTYEKNTNIYINVLDSVTREKVLGQAMNLTSDTGWYGTAYSHNYISPAATVTANGTYYACWIDQVYSQISTPSTTIFCSLFRYSNGQLTRTRGPLLMDTTSGNVSLADLTLAPAGNDRIMLTYTELTDIPNNDNDTQTIVYAVWNDQGVPILGRTLLTGSDGARPRLITFGSTGEGDALVGWETTDGKIAYSYLNAGASYAPYAGYPQTLTPVGDRTASNLSLTLERKGRAILTWVDADNNEYLYYAVLSSAREVVTAPMIFRADQTDVAGLSTSEYGFGNAGYQGVYQLFLPVASKK